MSEQQVIMYIHGYGSTGNATKGQLLRKMMPQYRVVSPTFDYDHRTPWQIQEQIRQVVEQEQVGMIVGSSFGGYQSLCATAFFHGPVWAVNPVHEVVPTIRRVILRAETDHADSERFVAMYADFDNKVFQAQSALNCSGQWPVDIKLHFTLSTDDELLGDHHPLLDLFPYHEEVVWKDHSGHRFFRFEELQSVIAQSIADYR